MKLRPYQEECFNALFAFFSLHPDAKSHPLCALPTGSGKAVIIAGFVQRVLQRWPGQRVLMLCHVKELVEQNADKLRTMWPQAPLGIYSAGLGEKTAHMPITFAGVQSVVKSLTSFGPQDIVIIDECHLVPPDEETTYRKVIAYFIARNPRTCFIGFSATIYRLGLGLLTEGGVFTHICYDITSMTGFNRLIDEGYLAPLIPMSTQTVLDVSGVKKRGGEFIAQELQKAVNHAEVTRQAVAETIVAAQDRHHWLIFSSGIDHAISIIEELRSQGIPCAGVWSNVKGGRGLTDEQRDENLRQFMSGEIRALVNVDVLTTGFDFPALDCIVLLRPTNSVVLHVQILGRGTRPSYAPGFDLDSTEGRLASIAASAKQNCLVLDFAGNTMRLGPINDPRIPKKRGAGTGDIPVKVCDSCGCLCHISARVCDNCGEPFSFEVKITDKASTAQLIVRDEPIVAVFDVKRITYEIHVKIGSPPSLKVNYYCGVNRYTEYVCLEHHGQTIIHNARKWWMDRTEEDSGVPNSIVEAMARVDTLARPRQIRVWVNQKFPKVLSCVF